jgi:hypothetical protein
MANIRRDDYRISLSKMVIHPAHPTQHGTVKYNDDLLNIVCVVRHSRGLGEIHQQELEVSAVESMDNLCGRSVLSMGIHPGFENHRTFAITPIHRRNDAMGS